MMPKFLLDSSAILHILAGTPKGQAAKEAVNGGENFTSIICYCEVLNTADLNKTAKAEAFLGKLIILGLGLRDGETAKRMQMACRRAGKHASTLDCLIAATASNNGLTLVSSDNDFERIDGVEKQML